MNPVVVRPTLEKSLIGDRYAPIMLGAENRYLSGAGRPSDGVDELGTLEVRDPIHGLIEFSPEEWKVINTEPFQRLRGIQQLAMTHLVYPGARHSRFEHSLGAGHIATRICEELRKRDEFKLPEEDSRLVRFAALVHDIGHGPFSHISEGVIRLPKIDEVNEEKGVHENLSSAILRFDPSIRKVLGEVVADEIADLLIERGSGKKRSLTRDVIAGPADVDKFDCLLRDSNYCGVTYGKYDLEKIIESVRCLLDPAGLSLAFHSDAVFSIEELLLARHHMHRQVYGHKTRLATDIMLQRSMSFGVEEGSLPADVFKPEGIDGDYVKRFLKWDDAAVTKGLISKEGRSGEIMRGLVNRRLMRRVVHLRQEELENHFSDQVTAGLILAGQEDIPIDVIRQVEERVAIAAKVDPMWVAVYWENRSNPTFAGFSSGLGNEDILLVNDDNKRIVFNRESEIFYRAEQEPRRYISLYVRPSDDESFSVSERAKLKEGLSERT